MRTARQASGPRQSRTLSAPALLSSFTWLTHQDIHAPLNDTVEGLMEAARNDHSNRLVITDSDVMRIPAEFCRSNNNALMRLLHDGSVSKMTTGDFPSLKVIRPTELTEEILAQIPWSECSLLTAGPDYYECNEENTDLRSLAWKAAGVHSIAQSIARNDAPRALEDSHLVASAENVQHAEPLTIVTDEDLPIRPIKGSNQFPENLYRKLDAHITPARLTVSTQTNYNLERSRPTNLQLYFLRRDIRGKAVEYRLALAGHQVARGGLMDLLANHGRTFDVKNIFHDNLDALFDIAEHDTRDREVIVMNNDVLVQQGSASPAGADRPAQQRAESLVHQAFFAETTENPNVNRATFQKIMKVMRVIKAPTVRWRLFFNYLTSAGFFTPSLSVKTPAEILAENLMDYERPFNEEDFDHESEVFRNLVTEEQDGVIAEFADSVRSALAQDAVSAGTTLPPHLRHIVIIPLLDIVSTRLTELFVPNRGVLVTECFSGLIDTPVKAVTHFPWLFAYLVAELGICAKDGIALPLADVVANIKMDRGILALDKLYSAVVTTPQLAQIQLALNVKAIIADLKPKLLSYYRRKKFDDHELVDLSSVERLFDEMMNACKEEVVNHHGWSSLRDTLLGLRARL